MKKAISLILTLLLIFNFLPLNFIIEALRKMVDSLLSIPNMMKEFHAVMIIV